MSKKMIYYFVGLFSILGIGVATLTSFLAHKKGQNRTEYESDKINLALRQTAHILLRQAGDSTATIEPVKKISDTRYLVKLSHNFNYDSLPSILNRCLMSIGINKNYDVAVWRCDSNELILGYSSIYFAKGEDIACGGRNKDGNCLNFTVTFEEYPSVFSLFNGVFYIGLGVVLASIGLAFYFFYVKKKGIIVAEPHQPVLVEPHLIYIGITIFDHKSQTIRIGNLIQKLTFRESKLLHLFCNHKNELLDRDYILKHVWEDEGVFVGRSLDVFVSRLRKLLKQDSHLKITNIHARGYKFEVSDRDFAGLNL